MARREYQNPKLKIRQSARGPEYYIRYRKRVAMEKDGKLVIQRKEVHHPLGLCKDLTQRQAERLREQVMLEVNGQVYTIQSHVPWGEFCRLFVEKHVEVELRKPTEKNYKQWLRKYIEPAFAKRKLFEIRPEDVKVFLVNLPVAPNTRRSIRGVLASMFRCAREWGYWREGSPLEFVRIRGGGVREKINLSWDQFRALLAAVLMTPSRKYRPEDVVLIIETLISTGMRISECLGLRWRRVDLETGLAAVTERQCRGDVDDTKSEQGRRVLPLGELVGKYRQFAKDRSPRPEDYVFTDREGRPIQDCALLANYLTPILERLGLKHKGMGWHMFRRMHITGLAQQPGVNEFDLRAQAGHASLETTKLYYVDEVKRREKAIRRIQEEYRGESLWQPN